MRRRWKVAPIALVAVLAFCAVAAASASANAPRWKVAGAYLGAGVSEEIAVTSGTSVLNAKKLNLKITCTGDTGKGKIVGSAAGSPGTNKEIMITYTGCTVNGSPTSICSVHSPGQGGGTIVTNPLKSELVWLKSTGNEAGDLLSPEGTNFVEIDIEGIECAAKQTKALAVTGKVIGKVLPVATEVTTGELVFPATRITEYWTGDEPSRTKHTLTEAEQLHFGGQLAEYESTEKVSLKSGKKFGVFQ